jgi:hypothetical protein
MQKKMKDQSHQPHCLPVQQSIQYPVIAGCHGSGVYDKGFGTSDYSSELRKINTCSSQSTINLTENRKSSERDLHWRLTGDRWE